MSLRRSRTALRPAEWLALAGALSVAALACSGGRSGVERPPGSAVWLGRESPRLSAEQLATLDRAGLSEVFLEAAKLTVEGASVQLEPLASPPLPRREATTLVVRGGWPDGELDTSALAASLGQGLGRLTLEAQGTGAVLVGVCFDLEFPPGDQGLETFASVLSELDRKEAGNLLVSAVIPAMRLPTGDAEPGEGLRDLADESDFLVAFLFGQRPRDPEDTSAWDLEAVTARLERLERLGRPYVLGVVTLGRALLLDADGRAREVVTEADLRQLATSPSFRLRHGFTLEGIDRQLYSFLAQARLRFGGLQLARGEEVQVERLAPIHLQRLRERLARMDLPHLSGEVYYRPPAPAERLSMSVEALAGALAAKPSRPRLEVRLQEPAKALVRAELRNASGRSTELSTLDSNYLELHLRRGSFGRVDVGQFDRYDLLDGATGRRTLEHPDTLRLFTSILEPGESLASGAIALYGARAEDVEADGSFLFPDGSSISPVAVVDATAPAAHRRRPRGR